MVPLVRARREEGDHVSKKKGLPEIAGDAAKRFDEKPIERASLAARKELAAPRDGFPAWLDTMTATKPFTIADCTELHAMLKKDMPGFAAIDVCFDDTHVHVRAYRTSNALTADLYRTLVLK